MSASKAVASKDRKASSGDDAVIAALKARLQALEREVVTLSQQRQDAGELLLKAKEQKARWFKKARDLRARLVTATGQAEPELEEDEPLEAIQRAALPTSSSFSTASTASSSSTNGHPPTSSSSSTSHPSTSHPSSSAAASTHPPVIYAPPHVLSFAEDSPFFRKQLHEHRARVEALGRRLKLVIDKSTAFCSATSRLAAAASELSSELSRGWGEVEADLDADTEKEDPVSLGSCMGKLGSILSTLSEISLNLKVSVDAFLVQSMDHFRVKHIHACADSVERLERVQDDYEAAIARRLSRRRKDMGPSGHLPHANVDLTSKPKGSKSEVQQEDDARKELATVATTRRQFELLRFDHTHLLNELLTERRLELIEMVCASFLAFITFFHDGCYVADAVKVQVDSINLHLQWKRPLYVIDTAVIKAQRKKMETHMASLTQAITFHVTDAIPNAPSPPPILPPSAEAATVVMRRGKAVRLEKAGYLRKQSSSLKKDWKRRWFVLQQGQLFYVRSFADLDPVHVVNVLICTVRASAKAELDLCFDLISPNKRVYTLQADTEQDMKDWMSVFQDCVESMLTSSSSLLTSSEKSLTSKELAKMTDAREVHMASLRKLNPTCADCDALAPDWASINLGVLVCIDCSGIHRSLGVHISKVRSITLDSWSAELLDLMLAIGNAKYNELYEGSVPHHFKPTPHASREEREEFINLKYGKRAFLSKGMLQRVSDPQVLLHQFLLAVKGEAILEMMGLLALQVDIDEGVVDEVLHQQARERAAALRITAARSASPAVPQSPRSPASSPSSDDGEGGLPQSASNPNLGDVDDEEDVGGAPTFHFPTTPVRPTPPVVRAASPPPMQAMSEGGGGGDGRLASRCTRALHVAARYDRVLSLEYLLQNNAKDALLDELGRTPLQVAVEYKSVRAQQRLTKKAG